MKKKKKKKKREREKITKNHRGRRKYETCRLLEQSFLHECLRALRERCKFAIIRHNTKRRRHISHAWAWPTGKRAHT